MRIDPNLLNRLTFREKEVIKIRYGLYGSAYSLEEASRIFKVAPERISMIEQRALKKLAAFKATNINKCQCEIKILMAQGCQCGGK